ncbi:MAG: G5 domain-containing protein [Candidatus Saccharimonadales bacterium]
MNKRNSFTWHKHPFVVPVITFMVLFFVLCTAFIFTGGETLNSTDSKIVNLHIDGKTQVLPTRAETVGDFLERSGIELQKEDVVEPMLNSPISDKNFNVNIYRAHLVTVVDETGAKTTARISESSPAAIASKAGLTIYPEDKVTYAPPYEVLSEGILGEKIVVDRAMVANVNLYGNLLPLRTHVKTVGDLLREKNVKTLEGDTIHPSLDTPITENIQIFIVRNGKQIVTVEEPIAPPVETRPDATLEIGKVTVVEPGVPGKRVVTYEIDTKNGKEVARKELQSLVAQEPKKRIVISGAKRTGFEGGFEAALARLRSCEGSYTSATGNGYYGAYQFDVRTWNNFGGYPNAAAAPPIVQDQKAQETYQRRGWQPWPSCSNKLGLQDIYR